MTNNTQSSCIECEKDIANKRIDAKYCSDRCRMRYGRKQKKLRLITNLYKACTNIPNHAFKSDDGETSIRIWNAMNKQTEIYTLKRLYSLNFQQIEALIDLKKREINMYNLLNPLLKK